MAKDNKVRVRCGSCGKRLKYSGDAAGRIFQCPVCGRPVVGALELPQSDGENAARAAQPQADPSPAVAAEEAAPQWKPGAFATPRNPAVRKMADFLKRDVERVGDEASSILAETIPDRQKTSRLREVRTRSLRRRAQLAEQLIADMRAQAQDSRKHPQVKDGHLAWQKEIREFQLYLSIVLQLDLSEPD